MGDVGKGPEQPTPPPDAKTNQSGGVGKAMAAMNNMPAGLFAESGAQAGLVGRAQGADAVRRELEGTVSAGHPGRIEGLFKKPSNEPLFGSVDSFASLTPERRQELADAQDTFIRGLIGVRTKDDLTPGARKFFDTMRDWVLGKITPSNTTMEPKPNIGEPQAPTVGGYYTDVPVVTPQELTGQTEDPEFNAFIASLRTKRDQGGNPPSSPAAGSSPQSGK